MLPSVDRNQSKRIRSCGQSIVFPLSITKMMMNSTERSSGNESSADADDQTAPSTNNTKCDPVVERRRFDDSVIKALMDSMLDKVVDSSPPVSSEIDQKRTSKKARGEKLGIKKKSKYTKTRYPNQANDFRPAIRKICRKIKTASGNLSIRSGALEIMNDMASDMFGKLADESSHLLRITKGKTLTENTVKAATKLVLVGELAVQAVQAASKALATTKLSRQ